VSHLFLDPGLVTSPPDRWHLLLDLGKLVTSPLNRCGYPQSKHQACLYQAKDGRKVLGSDVDATYLDEIQGIESLMLVPALVGTCALIGTYVPMHASMRVYQPALSQSPAGPSRNNWPLMVSIVLFRDTSFVTL